MDAPKRILVVDDEDSIRRLVARLLTKAGYAVESACDGDDAIDSVIWNHVPNRIPNANPNPNIAAAPQQIPTPNNVVVDPSKKVDVTDHRDPAVPWSPRWLPPARDRRTL